MPTMVARLHPSPLVDSLRALSPKVREVTVDRLLHTGIAALITNGPDRGGGGEPPGENLRIRISSARMGEVILAADSLKVPYGTVVREVLRAVARNDTRLAMELAYRARGLPGDPAHLGTAVLRLFLTPGDTPHPVLAALSEMADKMSLLYTEVENLKREVHNRPRHVPTSELLQMGPAALRNHLLRLGGHAPRKATRGALLALIREKENDQ